MKTNITKVLFFIGVLSIYENSMSMYTKGQPMYDIAPTPERLAAAQEYEELECKRKALISDSYEVIANTDALDTVLNLVYKRVCELFSSITSSFDQDHYANEVDHLFVTITQKFNAPDQMIRDSLSSIANKEKLRRQEVVNTENSQENPR